MAFPRKVGIYTSVTEVLDRPSYFAHLQEAIGLNVVILGFSGELPGEVQAESPFGELPPSREHLSGLLCHHLDGEASSARLDATRGMLGPHVAAGGDDAHLRRALERARSLGLDPWLLGGGWTSSDYDVVTFCPSQAATQAWYEAVYAHMASAYGVSTLDITHARFPMLSYPRGLFFCTCEHCAGAAAALGYDMGAMVAGLREAHRRVRSLDAGRVKVLLGGSIGAGDIVQLLGVGAAVQDWFAFRCDVLAERLTRIHTSVHAAAGDAFVFGVDTYPASLSWLVGHDHSRWDTFSDFASPLVSHVDIFGTRAMSVWSAWFRENIAGLSEGDALALAYHLVGYDGLGMPESVADLRIGEADGEFRHVPLVELVCRDLAKARAYLPEGIPSYPILQGGGAPHAWPAEQIAEILSRADAMGHDGVMWQGTSSLTTYPQEDATA